MQGRGPSEPSPYLNLHRASAAVPAKPITHITVSYTHLDVYKRQAFGRDYEPDCGLVATARVIDEGEGE